MDLVSRVTEMKHIKFEANYTTVIGESTCLRIDIFTRNTYMSKSTWIYLDPLICFELEEKVNAWSTESKFHEAYYSIKVM